jgi:hypothetical protein
MEYVPAEHDTHAATAVLAKGEEEPAAQFWQVEPTLEYVPAAHDTHAVFNAFDVEPAAQFWQVEPAMEYVPAAHDTHAVLTELVEGEEKPAPQSVHAPVPVVSLYFPATHAANGPPFGPVYPAMAKHAPTSALFAGELDPVLQELHAVLLVWAVISSPETLHPALIPVPLQA